MSEKRVKVGGNKKMPAFVGPLMAVVLLSVVLCIASDSFLTGTNIVNILRQASINALIALGMLMVLLTGGIDISVGSTAVLSGCVMGALLKVGMTNSVVLILAGLATGTLCGFINAVLFTELKLPHPFVSTMGTKMMFRGLALLVSGAAPIAGFEIGVTYLGYGKIWFIPICFLLVIVFYAIFGVFLNKIALGRKIYSVGGNKEAARLSGVNIKRTLNFTYVISGFMASVAGIVLIGRISSASPNALETAEMDAIASCVVGGASFLGGKGTVGGTLAGALLIGIIRNGLDLLGAQTDIKYIVIGLVIVVAVLVDVIRNRAEENRRRQTQAKLIAGE